MSSFSTMKLVAWIFFISIETSTSHIVRRRLTKHQVELDFNIREDFPDVLPVVLKSPDQNVNFSFTKQKIDYNVPVYTRSKEGTFIKMDTPPITDAAFYEDPNYGASVTLHCNEHGASFYTKKSCNIRSMSGFFHLDGHKHVIEPEKRDTKRVTLLANQNPTNRFVQKHRVYKLDGRDHSCNVKQNQKSSKNITHTNVNSGNYRIKRSKPTYTIEVLAVITTKMPINEVEIKNQKIYYTHVFWGVNMLYQNIDSSDASFGVNLIGFIVEPEDTHLYQFEEDAPPGDYLNGKLSLDKLASHPEITNADHIVMFSAHNISKTPSTVGLANVGAMCHSESVSLCRTLKSFEEIHVVAHEIGHSMNSIHDGEQNNCQESAGYIMSATTISYPDKQQILNNYKFSECSIKAMVNYAGRLNRNNCLLTNAKAAIVPTKATGQLYPPTEQCKTSPSSKGLCSSVFNRNNSDICLSIVCRKDEDLCKSIVPAYKTTCGNKKWCMFGQCVYDAEAPTADESCLLGDDENLKFIIQYPNDVQYIPKDCPDIISRIPNYCETPSQRAYCCKTCRVKENPVIPTSTSTSVSSSSSTTLRITLTTSLTTLSTYTTTSWFSTTTALAALATHLKSQLILVAMTLLYIYTMENYFTL